MVLSYATLDFIEGGVINAVIILNIVVGFFQDYRAEQTIQSLQAMAAPVCKVVRDNGVISTVKADELVPGDIVHLSVGDIVSADLRLATSTNLATDEALLTGESKPCSKNADSIIGELSAPLGDRHNIAYSSTTVTRGRAVGVVVATGMSTEIGKIAFLLRDKKQVAQGNWLARTGGRVLFAIKNALGLVGTPLQVKLSYFGLLLFGLAILLAIIVFSTALWDIDGETLIYGICVAVAVIPESLIAVLTITMAVGSKAMAKGNVIVRKMGALEAIGGVTNICSDKTGTLTQGKMLARMAYLADGRTLAVENETSPFDPTSGHINLNGSSLTHDGVVGDAALRQFFHTISVCNLASVFPPKTEDGANGLWSATGEPTEIALQVMAMRVGHSKADVLEKQGLRLAAEHSFDSSVKRMTVVYEGSDSSQGLFCFTKGATEVILDLIEGMDGPTKMVINAQADAMATQGLRVLCLARRTLAASDRASLESRAFVEQKLTFVGLVGLYDPPRLESASAIKQCQRAGITVHMLTGDHLKTATTIAQEIGILGPQVPGSHLSSAVMTAPDFDAMTDKELDELETLPFVVARCSPTTKLRMLDTLHRRGKYCVMTGDGVNDSPALKGADVGVAMGLNGSDVSKEAADMVLTDDNFASIVSAIREGRRLFDNIQKVSSSMIIYSCSLANKTIVLTPSPHLQHRPSRTPPHRSRLQRQKWRFRFPTFSPGDSLRQPHQLLIPRHRTWPRIRIFRRHDPAAAQSPRRSLHQRADHRQIHLRHLHGLSLPDQFRDRRLRRRQRRPRRRLQPQLQFHLRPSFPRSRHGVQHLDSPAQHHGLGSKALDPQLVQHVPGRGSQHFLHL